MTLTLFHGEGSNCCQRVKWVLAYKKIPHILVNVAEFTDRELLAMTPLAQVPVLKIGEQMLTESMAIVEYLEEIQPQPRLLPVAPLLKARVRELCEVVNTFVHPVQRTRVVKYFVPTADKAQIVSLRLSWAELSLGVVERMLSPDGTFAVEDGLTLADMFIIPLYIKYLTMGGDPLRFKRLAAMLEASQNEPHACATAPSELDFAAWSKPRIATVAPRV